MRDSGRGKKREKVQGAEVLLSLFLCHKSAPANRVWPRPAMQAPFQGPVAGLKVPRAMATKCGAHEAPWALGPPDWEVRKPGSRAV